MIDLNWAYPPFVADLVKAIKELQTKVQTLEDKPVSEMREAIDALKDAQDSILSNKQVS